MNELSDNMESLSVYAGAAELCKGCRKCELACIAAHQAGMTIKDAAKERKNLEPRIHVIKHGEAKMPLQCRHCESAPCAAVCPTRALTQGTDGELRMLDEYCAGCGLCVMACPYGAISLSKVKMSEEEQASLERVEPRKVAVSCDMCREWRAREGKKVTACMEACSFKVLHLVPTKELRRALREGAAPRCLPPALPPPPEPPATAGAQPAAEA